MGQGSQAMFVVLLILSIACILVWPPLALIAVIGIGLYIFLPDDCFKGMTVATPKVSMPAYNASYPRDEFLQMARPFIGSLDNYVQVKELAKAKMENSAFNTEHEVERRDMFDDQVERTIPMSVEEYRDGMDAMGELMARRAEITNPDPDDLIIDPELQKMRDEHQEMSAIMAGFNNSRFPLDDLEWVDND
jgi:hypothetical protein